MTGPGDDDVDPDASAPNVFAFLEELAGAVKTRLLPEAENAYLAAELNSLSSILRILAAQGPGLGRATEEDRRDLADLLGRLGHRAQEGSGQAALRRSLVRVMRAGVDDDAHRLILGYVRRDLHRGLPGLLPAAGDGRGAHAQSSPTTRPATSDLRSRIDDALPALPHLGRIHEVERATEGYGADTVVCTVDARERRIVLRIQWPELPLTAMLQPVETQAAVLRALAQVGFPVPSVLGTLEADGPLGAPALVTDYVDGVVPTTWTPSGRAFTRRLAGRSWSAFVGDLARLHAIGWREHGLFSDAAGGDTAVRQRDRVQRWTTTYRASELVPDPLIEDVLSRLLDGAPRAMETTLVHGDYRPGNIIYGDDTTVRAIIDWDGVVVNDYHEDLGHLLAWPWRDEEGRACGLAPDDLLLDEYARLSGRDVDPAAVSYYRLQSTFRRYLGFCGLARAFFDRGGDIRMARAWLALAKDRHELGRLLDLA